jgi:hypothetical protein
MKMMDTMKDALNAMEQAAGSNDVTTITIALVCQGPQS